MSLIIIFDIDGVIRDVSGSYRRAIADTVEEFTQGVYRPSLTDIDKLKSEGIWNNDWQASQELIRRFFASQGTSRSELNLDYEAVISFFQSRYCGSDAHNLTGYITTEPLLVKPEYFTQLQQQGISWGFFSGAPRLEAEYVLKRLGINEPILTAMEDAPDKPNPTGLFATMQKLTVNPHTSVIYLGDTVADMYTVINAQKQQPERVFLSVGILPPHVQTNQETQANYTTKLKEAGAKVVLGNVEDLSLGKVEELLVANR